MKLNKFLPINESVSGIRKVLHQYDVDVQNIDYKYKDKFYKVIYKIIKSCDLEDLNEIIGDDYDPPEINGGHMKSIEENRNTIYVNYYKEDNEDYYSLSNCSVDILYTILEYFINNKLIMELYNRSFFKKVNEKFTDRYRTNGYMMTDKNQDKVRKLLCVILDKLYGTNRFQEVIDELREDTIWLGDGVMFTGFNFNFSDKQWYIDTIEIEYDSDNDYTEDTFETYPIKDFSAVEIASLLDIIMEKEGMLSLLNKGYFKKFNENNKWVKTFELFNNKTDINI